MLARPRGRLSSVVARVCAVGAAARAGPAYGNAPLPLTVSLSTIGKRGLARVTPG